MRQSTARKQISGPPTGAFPFGKAGSLVVLADGTGAVANPGDGARDDHRSPGARDDHPDGRQALGGTGADQEHQQPEPDLALGNEHPSSTSGVRRDQIETGDEVWVFLAATGFDLGEGALLMLGERHDPTFPV